MTRRVPLRRTRVVLAAIALVGAACVSEPPPREPVRWTDLGRMHKSLRPTRVPETLAACGGDPFAVRAEAALSSWLEVVRHTDFCDLGLTRYYVSSGQVDAVTADAAVLASDPGPCGAAASRLVGRVRRAAAELRGLDTESVEVCQSAAIGADQESLMADMRRRRERLLQSIRAGLEPTT